MPLTGNILITGGAGTLGHAIVRQAQTDNWDCTFTIFSRSELRQAQMRAKYPQYRYLLGDVRDDRAVEAAVAGHETVIHAAAMKRLPECEAQPGECYQTNVGGSANVARACALHRVKTAIAISTDKACRSITAYGASKLLMESLWRSQPTDGRTIFTGVRYGNVVASNGSVIPLWRAQHARGEPLSITSQWMTRFWMSPTEAVKLIEVAAEGQVAGGFWVPKMGALSIDELARIVCPGAETVETGLRSVEKLHEDLLSDDEPCMLTPTHMLIGQGPTGARYSSATCPRLTADAFRAMLADAEALEAA